MAKNEGKFNIICLSNQLWDFPNWTNKRHVMDRLARLGNNVLFVDPPINVGRVFMKQVLRNRWGFNRLLTKQKRDSSGAVVFSPLNFLPFSKVTSGFHIENIKSVAGKMFDPQLKTILWIYHVEIKNLQKYIEAFNFDFLVYDCVDNYEAFPANDTPEKKAFVRGQERYLAQRANIVFATAPGLIDKLKVYNENVFFTPNVGDYEKFKNVRKFANNIPDDLVVIPRPRVGFTGSLDEYKFDANLVKKVAIENPDVHFVLIGQVALKDKNAELKDLGLEKINNIHFFGYRDYSIVQNYFSGFDAYMIPYCLNDYTVGGCFPVKFHDALAAGLPTIVTDLPAYSPFKNVCYIAKNHDDFSKFIKKSLIEDNVDKIKERQQVAKENDWNGKIENLLKIIRSYI